MNCPICLNALTDNDCYSTICGHQFHHNCLETWFNTSLQSEATCPVCREDLMYDRGTILYYPNQQIKKIINIEGQIMFYPNGNIKHNFKIDRHTNKILSVILKDETDNNTIIIPVELVPIYKNKLEQELFNENYHILCNI